MITRGTPMTQETSIWKLLIHSGFWHFPWNKPSMKLKDRITPHEKLTMYPLFGDLFPLTQRSFLRPRSLLCRPRSLLPRPRVCLYDWIYAAQSERSVNLNSTSMIECNRSRAVRPLPDAARAHLCVSWTSANLFKSPPRTLFCWESDASGD